LETMSPRYPLYVGTGAGLNVIWKRKTHPLPGTEPWSSGP
jgi:hypothetical protein